MSASHDDVLGTILAFATIALPISYLVLQFRMLRKLKGTWRLVSAIPVACWVTWAIILVQNAAFQGPVDVLFFEIAAASCVGIIYLQGVRMARRWLLRRSEFRAGGHRPFSA